MNLMDIMDSLGIPAAYGKFDRPQKPPFTVYLGAGQQQFFGDDTVYSKKNDYTLEYYFIRKDEAKEDALEEALLENGYIYGKSEDTYIEDENVFVIYYDLWRKNNG